MKRFFRKYRRTVLFAIKLFFVFVLSVIFEYVWSNFYVEATFFRDGNYLVLLTYVLQLLILTRIYGGFKIGNMRITELVISWMITTFLANLLTYFQLCLIARKILNPGYIIGLYLIQGMFIVFMSAFASKIYRLAYPRRQMLLVAQNEGKAALVAKKLKSNRGKFLLTGFITEEQGFDAIVEEIPYHDSIILCDLGEELKGRLVDYCFDQDVRVYIVPNVSDILINHATVQQISDTPVLLCKNRGLTIEQRFVKRAMDIFFSGLGIIITSPIMLGVAIAIKLYDHGPVLFKQKRVTENERVFEVLKFRSMIVDAEKNGAQMASKNDDRITPVGRFIRKTRLDELPQLLNIFRGDMSLVGPRPERVENNEEYSKAMHEFKYRLKVRAGLTGYAQIVGKYNTTPEDKLLLDLLYIQEYSIWLDIKLIFQTFKIIFIAESTEGVDEGVSNALDAMRQATKIMAKEAEKKEPEQKKE